MERVKEVKAELQDGLNRCYDHTKIEFSRIRAGKANPAILDGVMVDYYGTPTPITQVSSINTPDARTIRIQPWEKSIIQDIERAIINSNLGLNPQNDGENIRITMPILTEERRKDLVKTVKAEGENAKVTIRGLRKDANNKIKSFKDDGLSEDNVRDAEASVQKMIDDASKKIDGMVDEKEQEVMTV